MLGQNLTRDDVMVPAERQHILKKASKMAEKHLFSNGNLVLHIKSEVGIKLEWKVIATYLGYWAIHQTTVLGKGGQGEVLIAQDLITKKWAAVKVFSVKSINAETDFDNEKRNLKACDRLIDAAKDSQGNAYILMNYFPGEDLQRHLYTTNTDFLKEHPGYYSGIKPYSLLYRARLVMEIMEQIIWLHKKGIVHGDIKLENFLLNALKSHFDVRLVDLGAGRNVNSAEASDMSRVPGTFGYNDPALSLRNSDPAKEKSAYSFKNDLCSLGIVIAAICSNVIYPDLLRIKLAEQKAAGKKSELTFAEIKSMMPDMFVEPTPAPDFELPEDKTHRELMNEILQIVKALTNENVEERPALEVDEKKIDKYKVKKQVESKEKDKIPAKEVKGLVQMHTQLKAKVTKMWIEEEYRNPQTFPLSRDRSITARILPASVPEASAAAASSRLSAAGVTSPRNSRAGVTSPRTSAAGIVPSRSSGAGAPSPRAGVLAELHSPRKSVLFSNDDKQFIASSLRKLERELHGDCHPNARQLLKRNFSGILSNKNVNKNDSPPQSAPIASNLDPAPTPRRPKHQRAKSHDYRRSVTHTLSEDLEQLSITDDEDNKKAFRRSMS